MAKPIEDNTSCSTLETSLLHLEKLNLGSNDYQNAMVLHCGMCNTVWGDSLQVCGEAKQLNSIICLRVTKDVVVKDELEFRREGQLAGSTYKALHCSGCQCFVGIIPYSTPRHLSMLRKLFLLQKENVNCYKLRNSTFVKASSLQFDQSSLCKSIKELKQDLELLAENLSLMEKRLKEVYYGKVG